VNVWSIRGTNFNGFILIVACITTLYGCSPAPCTNEVLTELKSPDGKYTVTVFERNCGATTPYVEVVSLRPSQNEFASEDYDNWVFTIHGKTQIKVFWDSPHKMRISFLSTGDKPTEKTHWQDIVISYESA
jgi:Family of unknown function (DUF5412)